MAIMESNNIPIIVLRACSHIRKEVKMNILHFNKNVKSYTYPILKIIICAALIIAFIYRDRIFFINSKSVNIVIDVLCTAVGIVLIYCIYISACELLQAHENREEAALSDGVTAEGKKYSVDEIVYMAEVNDIIEIKIVSKNKIVTIGSSSDCKNGSSKFFDKLYYIDEQMFENIKDFKSKLLAYAISGQISVVSIDGIAQK